MSGTSSSGMGYTKDLMILAFDHRGSFAKSFLGIHGRDPNAQESEKIKVLKEIVFDGFKQALNAGVPKDKAGILVDEQYGSRLLETAKSNGLTFACPAEKSGQDEFDFEFGADYGKHIERFDPSFVKVLVRYNPDDQKDMNERQLKKLKTLSEYCQKTKRKFLFELLVPASQAQLALLGGDKKRYDLELRPKLMIRALQEFQKYGVEADIWKIEGVDSAKDAEAIAAQARSGGRSQIGVVVLGRGEDDQKVRVWLSAAAKIPAFIGFAVGRTIFAEPLKQFSTGAWTREQAVAKVSANYKGFVDHWMSQRK